MKNELLKTLTLAKGPSGNEKAVAAIIEKEITPYCDSVSYDKIGNLIARIEPKNKKAAKKRLFLAHMDEVGYMIQNIDDDGRLRVVFLGDVDTRTFSGRRVELTNGVKGIASSRPIHVLSGDERGKPTPAKSLYIELGSKDKAETETHCHIGDYGTYEPKYTELQNNFVAGKAIGGRSACNILVDLIKAIRDEHLDDSMTEEMIFIFSVKREIARRQFAVEAASYELAPDSAIVLDAVPANDFDGVKDHARFTKCNGGLVLSPSDMMTIYSRTMFRDAVATLEKENIKFQYPTEAGPGNEAGSVHKSCSGVPTLTVGIPTRNLHSGAEIINRNDTDAALAFVKLLVK